MKYLKNINEFLNNENFMGRLMINIFDYAAEILNYFRITKYPLTRKGLKSAIGDWMDNEFYTTDKTKIDPFLDKYEKYINCD